MELNLEKQQWQLKKPFKTARHELTAIRTITVHLEDGAARGWGEAAGVDNLGENVDLIQKQLEDLVYRHGIPSRTELQNLLPPGGARNALDCALWDMQCKLENRSIWELLDLQPQPITTVYTLPIEEPEAMAANARRAGSYPILKVKLDSDRPLQKMEAIRHARPKARLIVDCNQGWTFDLLEQLAPKFIDLEIEMIEQPLKVGEDKILQDYQSPIPLCADESCNTRSDLEHLLNKYQMINIKLDKTGGLTEALALAKRGVSMGFDLMVGNMLGTSLGMAPAFVIAQLCKYADLDGPLLQVNDREIAMQFDDGKIEVPQAALWG